MAEISQEQELANVLKTVDIHTRWRAASLSARGLLDGQIADILLLSDAQMAAIKVSKEFREKYSEDATKAIDQAIALEEGWDTLEDEALAALVQTMKYNKDPKFMLAVAATANRAERRSKNKGMEPKIIDASAALQNNILIFNINRNYVDKAGEDRTLDITPRPAQIPLKQSDMPAPKLVDAILSPAKEKTEISATDAQVSDIEQMAKAMGVVFDEG